MPGIFCSGSRRCEPFHPATCVAASNGSRLDLPDLATSNAGPYSATMLAREWGIMPGIFSSRKAQHEFLSTPRTTEMRNGHEKANRHEKMFRPDYREVWEQPKCGLIVSGPDRTIAKTLFCVGGWDPRRIVDEDLHKEQRKKAERYKQFTKRQELAGNEPKVSYPDELAIWICDAFGYLKAAALKQRRIGSRHSGGASESLELLSLAELKRAKTLLSGYVDLRVAFANQTVPDKLSDSASEEAKAALEVLWAYFFLRSAVDCFMRRFSKRRVSKQKRPAAHKASLKQENRQATEKLGKPNENEIATEEQKNNQRRIILHMKSPIVVKELAAAMGLKSHHVISDLLKMKKFAVSDQVIDRKAAAIISKKRGFVLHGE